MVGNQEDVDAINQVTLEMDAAFGVGNWNFNDNPSDDAPHFVNIAEVQDYIETLRNSFRFVSSDIIDNGDNTYVTRFKSKFDIPIPVYLNAHVNSSLDDYSTSIDEYNLESVTSFLTGFTPALDWEQDSFGHSVFDNSVTINLNGHLNIGLKLQGFDFTVKEAYYLNLVLNKRTGQAISMQLTE